MLKIPRMQSGPGSGNRRKSSSSVQNHEYDLGKGHAVFSARIVPIHALNGNPGIQMTYSTSFCVMDTIKVPKLAIYLWSYHLNDLWISMSNLH